eukprot:CAMPEP_0173456088 /NCGR_PEP_ID=MMETSP1357-20121228/55456_1 /TAXON_ID=77926 /ORGANISM="Hemiselmis rufescens, Strain PCC563" /LENGTH=43 /DNA_ID= /DNA_START= /DNA_END= /DNA_ORIENTATION=
MRGLQLAILLALCAVPTASCGSWLDRAASCLHHVPGELFRPST